MTTQILQNIRSLVQLNDEEQEAFLRILEVKKFNKKELLLQEGQVCNKVTYINSGVVRLFYTVEGVENTIQFFFGDRWYTDFASFLTGTPTLENLQALQPCEVVQIEKEDLYRLYADYPVFEKVGKIMAENAFLSVSLLNQMRANMEPELRYLNLLKERPELLQQIPQHYVASYLGIKPESLSRIKKRILESK